MSFFKDVGNFFSKEIPKFVTETVPSVFEKETYAPDLVEGRKEVERLKKAVEASRDRFFEEQAQLAKAQSRFENLTEQFANAGLSVDTSRFTVSPSLIKELSESQRTVRDIMQAYRTVTNVMSLGLTELIYIHADIKEERETLKRQIKILKGTRSRFDQGTDQLIRVRKAIEAETVRAVEALKAAGIEDSVSAVSELTAAEAQVAARQQMAARLLGIGTEISAITDLIGFSETELAAIHPILPEEETSPEAIDRLMTEEEKAILQEANG
ncbi:MAG: hypothetical protein AAGI10_00350 [Pseudomonadota bacterium]